MTVTEMIKKLQSLEVKGHGDFELIGSYDGNGDCDITLDPGPFMWPEDWGGDYAMDEEEATEHSFEWKPNCVRINVDR